MGWKEYFFGSGIAFFAGIGLLFVSLLALACFQLRAIRIVGSLACIVGCLFIAISATPLPILFYVIAAVVTVLWLIAERSSRNWLISRRNLLRVGASVVWVAAAAIEAPYQITPTISAADRPKLYILADSVAAGVSDGEKGTWPRVLASTYSVPVVDLSRMGATASSAMKQADGLPPTGGMVLLEIGGNDVLGTTSAAKFDEDLQRLLDRVCISDRVVLMFELPLPPLYNEFGRVQRRQAAEHGVRLIPKRIFMRVLTESGNTLDSIHLSAKGHEQMAEEVWKIIRPAYDDDARVPNP